MSRTENQYIAELIYQQDKKQETHDFTLWLGKVESHICFFVQQQDDLILLLVKNPACYNKVKMLAFCFWDIILRLKRLLSESQWS